jgi:hypothetical protein
MLRQGGLLYCHKRLCRTHRGIGLAALGYDLDSMNRLLTLLIALMLVLTHGAAVAAAICRHQDGLEHAAALQSEDAGISAAAQSEETAGKAVSKKGAPAGSGSVSLASDMLPAPGLPVPFPVNESRMPSPGHSPMLVGASVRPLLEPPSA